VVAAGKGMLIYDVYNVGQYTPLYVVKIHAVYEAESGLTRAVTVEVAAEEWLRAVTELLSDNQEILMARRDDELTVPNMPAIADLLLAARAALAKAPRPKQLYEGWAWSPLEEAASRKAAILLDIAAMILRHPEAASKLPEDVEMLVKKHSEGTLFQYIKSAKAEVVE